MPNNIRLALLNRLQNYFPSCKEVARLKAEDVGRKLTLGEPFKMKLHLLVCSWCRRYGKQVRQLRTEMDQHPEHVSLAPATTLSTESRARMKRALSEQ